MTVSAQTPINRSAGNGVTTVFPYTFKIIAEGDIEVSIDDVVKTLNVDYTVSGVGVEAGGNITMTTAPANLTIVVRRRNMAFVRTIDYQDQGTLPAATLDNDNDAPVMMIQQVNEQLGRSLTMRPSVSGVSLELPSPAALNGIGWDAAGTALENYPLQAGTPLVDLAASSGASLVGYLPSGTGAVVTTAQEKLRQSVSVFDFMSAAQIADVQARTALVDISAAFQAAFDNAKLTGKSVYAPAGTYKFLTGVDYITTSADTFTPGVELFGDGPGRTIFVNASNSTLFDVSTDTALKFQMDGKFSGFSYSTSGTATSAACFDFKAAFHYSLSHIRIVGGRDGVIITALLGDSDACNNITFDHVRIEDCVNWGIKFVVGAAVNENSFISLRNTFIQGCGTLDGVGGGMYWKGQALYMEQTAFVLNNNRGLYIEGGAGLPNTVFGANVVFENNIGKALECWGVQGLELVRSQCYANDGSYAGTNKGHLFYFNGGASVIRNVRIDGVVVRATAANNPITAFHVQGANADVASIRITDISYDNFANPGQTKFSGCEQGDYPDCVIAYQGAAFNLTTTQAIVPFDTELLDRNSRYTAATGKFNPLYSRAYRLSGQIGYTASAAGEGLIVALYNVTDAATVQQQIFRSSSAFSDFYVFEFSQVLTAGKDYAIYASNGNGTRAMVVGSSGSRLLIQAI